MKGYFALFLSSILIVSCGGGSGDSGSNGDISISVERNSVSVVAKVIKETIERINITINNVPESGIYYGVAIENENSSIVNASFIQTTDDTGDLIISFAKGYSLGQGNLSNQVALVLCLDEECQNQINGSPVIIDTSWTFSGIAKLSSEQNTVVVEGNRLEPTQPNPETVSLGVSGADARELFVSFGYLVSGTYESGISAISSINKESKVDINFDFASAQTLTPGMHRELHHVSVCYDISCNYPLSGSPYDIEVNYQAYDNPPNYLSAAKTIKLSHNVVDSEYSNQLDAVVIASSKPDNSLYVYKGGGSLITKIPLRLTPTSVGVLNAGDSNKLVVGHNEYITYADVNMNNPATSTSKVLKISAGYPFTVADIAATDTAIFLSIDDDYSEFVTKLDIDTAEVIPATQAITEPDHILTGLSGSKIKILPSLDYLYLADKGSTPDEITKFDGSDNPPTELYDSPYHGDYEFCGNLWINNLGNKIYTACGNVFNSSSNRSDDLVYAGNLVLSTSAQRTRVVSVAESGTKNEITVIENEQAFIDHCDEGLTNVCSSPINFYEKDTLALIDSNLLRRQQIGSQSYAVIPKFIFYNNAGDKAYLLAESPESALPTSYLYEVQR